MAIAVVQRATAQDTTSSGTVSKAFTSTPAAGNAIIAIVGINNNITSLGVPDDGHNPYQLAAKVYQASMNVGFVAYIAYNVTAVATTVSCSDNFNQGTLFIYEVSGLASNNAFDTSATQQITGVSCVSPNITPATSSELLLGIFGTQNTTATTFTVGTGYSNIQTNAVANWSTACEEQIVSSNASINAAAGGPSGQISQCGIVAFSATPIIGLPHVKFNNSGLRPHPFSPGLAR